MNHDLHTLIRSDLIKDLIETLLRYRDQHPDLTVAEGLTAFAMAGPAVLMLAEKEKLGDAK